MNNFRKVALVLTATLLVPIIPFLVIGELPGERWLTATGTTDLAFAATGAGLLALDVFLPIPSSILITLLGARLDLAAGWPAAWLGLTIGQLLGYAAGRLWPVRWAPDLARAPTAAALVLTRPVPVLAEALALAAGAARSPFSVVAGSIAIGNAIYTLVLCAAGAALLEGSVAGWLLAAALLVAASLWWWSARLANAPTAQEQAGQTRE